MRRIAYLVIILVATIASQARAEDPVDFADANLKAAVETALGKTNPTPTDMLGLSMLFADGKGIFDLTGLEYATNLTHLHLSFNQISDLSPLAGLTGLKYLGLSSNQISDLSIFSTMSMVNPVGSLYLGGNPLNAEAVVHITAFKANNPGWNVFYDTPTQKTLTVSSDAGGTVTDPGIGSFLYTRYLLVSITAVPYTSYHFVEWSGTAVDAADVADPSAAGTTVDMYDNYTLHANFAIDQHTLTISSTAGGSVTTPGEGSYQYDYGSSVPVTATAQAHYHFTGWTGTAVDAGKVDNPSSANTNVTVDADYTLVANFAIDQHTLTISSTAGGSVTTPGEGPYQYNHGTVVLIGATPAANYHFVNWTGTAVDAGKVDNPSLASTNVTVDADYTLVANFAIDQHTLTISSTAGGSVNIPGEGAVSYAHGTEVLVVATPAANYHFLNWTGTAVDAGKVANPSLVGMTVIVDSDYTLVANFAIDQHTLTISSTAGGSVTTPGEGPYQYNHGTVVSILATPAANYHFVNWTGTAVSAGKVDNPSLASTNVTVDADYTLQANFAIDQRTLTLTSSRGGSITDPGEGTFEYDYGSELTLTPSADSNYHFANWSGDIWTIQKSITITMDSDYSLHASFAIDQRTLAVSSTSGGSVTTPGEGSFKYDHGTIVSIVATAEANCYFMNWTGTAVDAGKVADANSANTTVVLDADYTLQARFVIEGTIIYVDTDATGANDGSSWMSAYNYLQDALADANSVEKPVEVLVAQGIYKPDEDTLYPEGTGDREATIQLINDVTVRGGYAGFGEADPNARDIELYETILSGNLNSENSYHVVTSSSTDRTAVLDGFTIIGGNANGSGINDGGGGMYNSTGSPTVKYCKFIGNLAGYGGGIENCSDSNPILINCIFLNNSAGNMGGGIYEQSSSGSTLINCSVSKNYAPYGGGIYNSDSNTALANCTFAWNLAQSGGGINISSGNIVSTNCIFWGNSDTDGRDESAQFHVDGGVIPVIDFCCIEGWTNTLGCVGNIGDDPMFISNPDDGGDGWGDDPTTPGIDEGANDDFGDLRLTSGSPCIDAGDNTAVPFDTTDLDGDEDVSERIPFDLDGNPRFVDDPLTFNTGVPDPPDYIEIVDMGAYEFTP